MELGNDVETMTKTDAVDLGGYRPFQRMVNEMHNVIDAEKEKLLHETDHLKMIVLQERIKALRFTTRYPEIVADREAIEDPSIITGD